ncbi:MAG: hypothetical protein ACOYCB_14060 [Fastidiosipilaceae bacterium]|jgi:hypothetical protein
MWRKMYPWQAIRWNAEGDGGSAGNQNQNPGSNDGNGDGAGGDGGDGSEIRLTSAQLAERLERQSRTAIGKLLSDLGVEKVDDLKTTLQNAREREQAEMTEVQRLQAQLAEYQQKEQQWAQEKRAQALQIAVQTAAAKLGIVDPDVALALVQSSIEYDDAGTPQGVEAALTELLTQKPYLKAQPAPTGGSPTNPPRSRHGDDPFTTALYKGAGLKKE